MIGRRQGKGRRQNKGRIKAEVRELSSSRTRRSRSLLIFLLTPKIPAFAGMTKELFLNAVSLFPSAFTLPLFPLLPFFCLFPKNLERCKL